MCTEMRELLQTKTWEVQLASREAAGLEPKLPVKHFAFRLLRSWACWEGWEQQESRLDVNNERRIITA